VACQAPVSAASTCHSFNGAGDTSYGFTLANNRTASIIFQWAEPRFGVTQNFDILLYNTATNGLVGSSTTNNVASGQPFEFISHTNSSGAAESLALFIRRTSGTGTPRMKLIFPNPSGISAVEYTTPVAPGDTVGATIYGHVGAAGELAVSATPFNDGTNPETFTSHGPMTFLFGPVNGTTPASAITPVTRQPDMTATDGGANTFFGNLIGGTFRFFGTSQAAPHAAGVAALLRQKVASATPDQIKTALTSTATAMNGGVEAVGAGRVNAVGALNALAPTTPPPPPPPPCPSSRITRSVSEVSAGRLQVALSTTSGSFSTISTTGLSNATLEVNGAPLAAGQSATLTGSTATLFVQRAGGGGSFIARFSVVDGCGTYPLFFGKGS
jgi:subtilisin family serine protease